MAPIDDKINDLQGQIQKLMKETEDDQAAQAKLFGVCRQAADKLENPFGKIFTPIWSMIACSATATVVEMRIPYHITKSNSALTNTELADITGYDPYLIVRLMRPLVALGFFSESGPDTYGPTSVTAALAEPGFVGGFRYILSLLKLLISCESLSDADLRRGSLIAKSMAVMPEFLLDKHRSNAYGKDMFQHAFNTDKKFFDYIADLPGTHNGFNLFMPYHRAARENWYDKFSPEEVFGHGSADEKDSPLFVDVAGGNGHVGMEIRKKLPGRQGKWIVEDLPETIERIENLDPAIVPIEHDFFKPQPVKGARAYYFRSIMHDWSDDACVKILRNIVPAMKRGYSKVLIDDSIVPEMGTPLPIAVMDLLMMAQFEGAERTEKQWNQVIKRAGLKVTRMRKFGRDNEGLIEAELADDA